MPSRTRPRVPLTKLGPPQRIATGKSTPFIPPCEPTTVDRVPTGDAWLHEIKFDGFRVQAHLRKGEVRVFTRRGLDWSRRVPSLVSALASIGADDAILDGEMIVTDAQGRPSFDELQAELGRGAAARLQFVAFDVLRLQGRDKRALPFVERRTLLEALILRRQFERMAISEVFENGERLFETMCEAELEGVVSKMKASAYHSGKRPEWVKVKCHHIGIFTIIGFTPAAGRSIAALRLARREGRKLFSVGKVGTGFSDREARALRARLDPHMVSKPVVPIRDGGTVWVTPALEVRVQYRALTADGNLRAASFLRVV